MRTEAEIKFECDQCGQRLSVAPDAAGASVTCPSCEAALIVPESSPFEASDSRASRLSDSSAEITALREQLLEATLSCGRLEHDLVAARHEIDGTKEQLRTALESQDSLVGTLAQLTAEKREWEVSLKEASQRLEQLRQENRDLLRQNQSGEEELSKAREQVQLLTHDFTAKVEAHTQLQKELVELKAQAVTHRTEAERTQAELLKLRNDLQSTGEGRELLALQKKLLEQESACKTSEQALAAAHKEAETLTAERERVRSLLAETAKAREEAERKLKELADSEIHQNNTVLRSIVERQKGELEHLYSELKRLRRAQLGLRLAYALFALGLLALCAWAVQSFPGLDHLF